MIPAIILFVFMLSVLLFLTLRMLKIHKEELKFKKELEDLEGKRMLGEPAEDENIELIKIKVYCAYCGTELDENTKKCPHCGANKKIEK